MKTFSKDLLLSIVFLCWGLTISEGFSISGLILIFLSFMWLIIYLLNSTTTKKYKVMAFDTKNLSDEDKLSEILKSIKKGLPGMEDVEDEKCNNPHCPVHWKL